MDHVITDPPYARDVYVRLGAPKTKKTHTSTPPDDGRYDLRYRLRRVRVNGRVVRVADERRAS